MARWTPQRQASRRPKVFGRSTVTGSPFMTIDPAWWYCTNTNWTNAYYSSSPEWSLEKRTLERFLMDVRIIDDYHSLILIHLRSEAEVELFLTTANKIGLQLKGIAAGYIPEIDRPYEKQEEVVRVHVPYPIKKAAPKPKQENTNEFTTNEFVRFSEFLREISRAYSFQKMSKIEDGKLIMTPLSDTARKWAESIKIMLAEHGVREVVIR